MSRFVVVFVPSAWDTAPSLDTYHRVFVDPVLKSKMQAGIDKILQTKDAKMLENQTREEKSTTGNIEIEMKLIEIKPINEITSATRNALMLLLLLEMSFCFWSMKGARMRKRRRTHGRITKKDCLLRLKNFLKYSLTLIISMPDNLIKNWSIDKFFFYYLTIYIW